MVLTLSFQRSHSWAMRSSLAIAISGTAWKCDARKSGSRFSLEVETSVPAAVGRPLIVGVALSKLVVAFHSQQVFFDFHLSFRCIVQGQLHFSLPSWVSCAGQDFVIHDVFECRLRHA